MEDSNKTASLIHVAKVSVKTDVRAKKNIAELSIC